MKKVLKLVKSRKSSTASSTKGSSLRSPSKGSLGQASSSIGGESASATSMIYESQRNKRADDVSTHSQDERQRSPSRSTPNQGQNSQSQNTTVREILLIAFSLNCSQLDVFNVLFYPNY